MIVAWVLRSAVMSGDGIVVRHCCPRHSMCRWLIVGASGVRGRRSIPSESVSIEVFNELHIDHRTF